MSSSSSSSHAAPPSARPAAPPARAAAPPGSSERRLARDGRPYSALEFAHHYGATAWREQWDAAPRAQPERRAAADGEVYTREEFVAEFGPELGEHHWHHAAHSAGREERRIAADGRAQTRREFLRAYGLLQGAQQWLQARAEGAAAPRSRRARSAAPAPARPLQQEPVAAAAPGPAAGERRVAEDGGAYTFAEFVGHYGQAAGAGHWRHARAAAAQAGASLGSAPGRAAPGGPSAPPHGAAALEEVDPITESRERRSAASRSSPRAAPVAVASCAHILRRQADDGQWYTLDEFVAEWGDTVGRRNWRHAGLVADARGKDAGSPAASTPALVEDACDAPARERAPVAGRDAPDCCDTEACAVDRRREPASVAEMAGGNASPAPLAVEAPSCVDGRSVGDRAASNMLTFLRAAVGPSGGLRASGPGRRDQPDRRFDVERAMLVADLVIERALEPEPVADPPAVLADLWNAAESRLYPVPRVAG